MDEAEDVNVVIPAAQALVQGCRAVELLLLIGPAAQKIYIRGFVSKT
jgi:hypothetical protein